MSKNNSSLRNRILIIDDQPFIIKLIQYNLKKNGYETITETDGIRAFEIIDEIAPDLILLDIRMPKISGTELCRRIRKKENMKNIPVIILTGQPDNNTEDEAKESGATDFMTKPFSPQELVEKIDDYLKA